MSPKRYDETADTAMAIIKYGLATPYNRSAALQRDCGMPLSESAMSERCKAVSEALYPIYEEMRHRAADGKVFYGDDTPVRILELMKENKEKEPGETEKSPPWHYQRHGGPNNQSGRVGTASTKPF